MFELEDIIKSTNMYLVAKDRHLKFIYCSEQFAELRGLDSPSQILGKTDYEFYSDDMIHLYHSADNHVLKTAKSIIVREKQPVYGKLIEVLTTKTPLRNKSGSLTGVLISFMELTTITPNCHINTSENSRHKFFTKCEYMVFNEIIMGLTAKEIAKKLALSPRTVEDYIDRIKIKLQCTSKHHIVEAAIRLGILQQHVMESVKN